MKSLSFQSFNKVYQDVVLDVYKYWTPQMQMEIAAHNYGWDPGLLDVKMYLQASSVRFYKAYQSFAEKGNVQTVCDVGGFWGVFSITLKELGYDVTMTESLQYYSDSFSGLFKHIADRGVTVIDYDPFQTGASPPGSFDFVTVMAVLEHYPHSLSIFIENIVSIMRPSGKLYIEVPNIAYWPKRINLLLGRTPLAPLEQIFKSKVPFIGHHHEFTISELRDLARLGGLSVISENFYNYSPHSLPSLKRVLRNPIQFLAFSLLKDSRECLAILCTLKNQEQ